MNQHNVFTCGVIREVADVETGGYVVVSSCVHGRSASVWQPVTPVPERPIPVTVVLGGSHANRKWTPERLAAFAKDWNGDVDTRELAVRYQMRDRSAIRSFAAKMRAEGVALADRRAKERWRPRVIPSGANLEAHALTSAGAFGRAQFR